MSIDERFERADLPSCTGTTGMRPQLQISTMLWSGSCRKIFFLLLFRFCRERGEKKGETEMKEKPGEREREGKEEVKKKSFFSLT